MIRIVFMGTPEFAVPSLQAISKLFEITAVITQPDKPAGRKHVLTPPPVKIEAEKLGIPVLQPKKLSDIKIPSSDLIVIAAYGKIIPKSILDIPKHGAINVHPSLLPKYRGASPIRSALASGETETGVSIMQVDEEMDHGPILAQEKMMITPDETSESLGKKLASLGADLLVQVIPDWIAGKITPQAQDHSQASFTKMLRREDGKIDWNESAEVIERKIRAYHPWPGTWTMWDGKRLNIIKVQIPSPLMGEGKGRGDKPGTILKTPTGFAVICGQGALEILQLQLEGKREMPAQEFLCGHPDIIDSRFSF